MLNPDISLVFCKELKQSGDGIFIQCIILRHPSFLQSYDMVAAGEDKLRIVRYDKNGFAHVTQFQYLTCDLIHVSEIKPAGRFVEYDNRLA